MQGRCVPSDPKTPNPDESWETKPCFESTASSPRILDPVAPGGRGSAIARRVFYVTGLRSWGTIEFGDVDEVGKKSGAVYGDSMCNLAMPIPSLYLL